MIGQILIFSLVTGTQVLLMALALFLVYSVGKIVNLSFGGIAAGVAYSLYFAFSIPGIHPLFLFLIPLVVALILGLLNFLLNEPFTRRNQSLFGLLVSFSFGVLIESVLAILFGSGGKSFLSSIVPAIRWGGYQIPIAGVGIILTGLVCMFAGWFFFRGTPWGRKFKAISENSFSAVSLGLNPKTVRVLTYLVGSMLVGGLGILSGFLTALTPTMGFNFIIMAFIAFLVGGVSDIRGTIIASYLVTLIPEIIVGISPGLSLNWRVVFVFLVAVFLLILKPRGLFSSFTRTS